MSKKTTCPYCGSEMSEYRPVTGGNEHDGPYLARYVFTCDRGHDWDESDPGVMRIRNLERQLAEAREVSEALDRRSRWIVALPDDGIDALDKAIDEIERLRDRLAALERPQVDWEAKYNKLLEQTQPGGRVPFEGGSTAVASDKEDSTRRTAELHEALKRKSAPRPPTGDE